MQKIVMSLLCLLGTVFLSGMESASQIVSGCSRGAEVLKAVLLKKPSLSIIEAREIILPIALTSKELYCIFDTRQFVYNIIAQCELYSGKPRGALAKALKIRRANNYIHFNHRMYISTISSYFDKKTLKQFRFFLELGGDPHYSTPLFGKTFLMNAVHFNNPRFVEFLLNLKVSLSTRDHKGRTARHFNLIYDAKELEKSLYFIINYLCPLGMRCRLRPNDSFDMTCAPFVEAEIKRLAKALYIDKVFEEAQAEPVGNRKDNPLLMMLAARDGLIVREVLREIYRYKNENMKKGVPQWLYKILYVIKHTLPDTI